MLAAFQDGDFAIFRLTPEKYHYNHTRLPQVYFYPISGFTMPANPNAVVSVVTPIPK